MLRVHERINGTDSFFPSPKEKTQSFQQTLQYEQTCKCLLAFGNSGSSKERFHASLHKEDLFKKKIM